MTLCSSKRTLWTVYAMGTHVHTVATTTYNLNQLVLQPCTIWTNLKTVSILTNAKCKCPHLFKQNGDKEQIWIKQGRLHKIWGKPIWNHFLSCFAGSPFKTIKLQISGKFNTLQGSVTRHQPSSLSSEFLLFSAAHMKMIPWRTCHTGILCLSWRWFFAVSHGAWLVWGMCH